MKNVKFRALSASLLVLASLQATAADIAREVVTSNDKSDAFAEIRFSLVTGKNPLIGFNDKDIVEESDDTIHGLNISLDARFRYKRFFIDFVEDSFSNLSIGYILASSDRSSVELLATNLFNDIERDSVAGFTSITERKSDVNLGFRSSVYRGDNVFQFDLMTDVSDSHGGVVGALHAGRQKQIRNWNLHGLLGVRYFSGDVIDHYFGVSAEESTASVPEYVGDAGILPSVQIGASLPLSEKWVFKTKAQYSYLPESVRDSPLAQGDAVYTAQVGVAYVFGGR